MARRPRLRFSPDADKAAVARIREISDNVDEVMLEGLNPVERAAALGMSDEDLRRKAQEYAREQADIAAERKARHDIEAINQRGLADEHRQKMTHNAQLIAKHLPSVFMRVEQSHVRRTDYFNVECSICGRWATTSIQELIQKEDRGQRFHCRCQTMRKRLIEINECLPEGHTHTGEIYSAAEDKLTIHCPEGPPRSMLIANFRQLAREGGGTYECKRCSGTDKRFKKEENSV